MLNIFNMVNIYVHFLEKYKSALADGHLGVRTTGSVTYRDTHLVTADVT